MKRGRDEDTQSEMGEQPRICLPPALFAASLQWPRASHFCSPVACAALFRFAASGRLPCCRNVGATVFSQHEQLPLPLGTLSDDEIEMLQDAVGYSQEDVFQAVHHFLQRGTQWDLATFTEYMVEKGVKEAYCPHYFR